MADTILLLSVALDEEEEQEDDDDEVLVFSVVSAFMRRRLNRISGFFEEIVPAYFDDEFQSHFRLSRNTAEILTREVVATGHIRTGNRFGRTHAIPPAKQVLVYLWIMANARETTRQVADRFNIAMSSCDRVLRRVNTAVLSLLQRYIKWPNAAEMRDIAQNFKDSGMPGVIGQLCLINR